MGDADWAAWYDEHAPALILYARQWSGSHADAEDAVQDAFIRFWRSGRHRAKDPAAYLFASVKRSALDLGRGDRRRRRREGDAGLARPEAEALFDSAPERDEWRAQVESALARLPAEQREVLVLKLWGGLTFPQVAEVCGVSPNTAASRYRYALAALRRQLAEEVIP